MFETGLYWVLLVKKLGVLSLLASLYYHVEGEKCLVGDIVLAQVCCLFFSSSAVICTESEIQGKQILL